jgi:hypothetical protein
MPWRRRLALAALAALAALTAYGFLHERLFAQLMWTPVGERRFLIYTAVFWAAAGSVLWLAPRWIGVIAAGFALVYTIWWSGFAAPFAALYFFGACFLTGRIFSRRADAATATLLGMAGWMFAIWIALHFPVNTRATYAIALAVPYLWHGRKLPSGVRVLSESRKEALGLALLLFLLMAHWLIALKPEVSDDGLSMHLALPMAVAHDHRWAFDFQQNSWSLMPVGGDGIFTAAYLLGGETAARLTNFGLLVLMTAMVIRVSRQWLPPGRAFVAGALFASTPLVQLVTGSLFVENVWAAMILGASLAIVRFEKEGDAAEIRIAGALFGAALAVKLIAAIYLAPAAVIAIWIAVRRRAVGALLSAALLFAILAVPPYLYAFVKSGNPVFPFLNNIFRSPYFDATKSFTDRRFVAPMSWHTFYDSTFRSGRFFEGQGGGAGFQYLLLLIPAALLVRRRELWPLLAIGGTATIGLFAFLPNLRYCYPALPLFSIAIGSLLAEWPPLIAAAVALTVLNAWFFPASGWYQNDFAPFRRDQVTEALENSAPERKLIEYLNQSAPGEPVAFFASDVVAGLHAPAYTDTWHAYSYWTQLSAARSATEAAAVLRERNIHHIVAPLSLQTPVPLLDTFLREWAEPEGVTNGRMGLFRLRETPSVTPRDNSPFPPGNWDDLDQRVEYTGAWIHDRQFAEPLAGSVTYSSVPGDSLRLSFTGSSITYIFTKALNRGIALVLIDGNERARIDTYSKETVWRSERVFTTARMGARTHTLEVRVLEKKNPASSGTYVDLDGIVVNP